MWKETLAYLEHFGIDSESLVKTIESDIPEHVYRELTWAVLKGCFLLTTGEISNQVLHDTFKTIMNRMWEIATEAHKKFMSVKGKNIAIQYMPSAYMDEELPMLGHFLAEMSNAEGYRLDEALMIDSLILYLQCDELIVRKFFNIQGHRLPKLLTQALEVVGPYSGAK